MMEKWLLTQISVAIVLILVFLQLTPALSQNMEQPDLKIDALQKSYFFIIFIIIEISKNACDRRIKL
jgi:hypothetical protein